MTIGIRFSDANIGYFTSTCARDCTYLLDSDCRVNVANVDVINQTLLQSHYFVPSILYYLVLVCIIYVSNEYSFSAFGSFLT